MLRLIVIVATLCLSFDYTTAEAQSRGLYRNSQHRHSHGQGFGYPPYPIYDYGRGYYGYVYDPYASGRFKSYDPSDDLYLREKYKYDTFFPGRRSRRSRLRRRR
jgi:hypothetical protein